MSSSKTNTCPFADIPLNGLFEDHWSKEEGVKIVVMQKTGNTTAVVHNDPLSTVYTYGPNKLVEDLHRTGDTINPLPLDEVAALTAGIGFDFEPGGLPPKLLARLIRTR